MKLVSKSDILALTVQLFCNLPLCLLICYWAYSKENSLPVVPFPAVILLGIIAILGEIWTANYYISKRKYILIPILDVVGTSSLAMLVIFLYSK
ncbi:MAG: hypothetical protein HXL75_08570 [[Eubacterium] sulci]|jgi:hypothetical protein|nr:hypothetical protein [[Eubacterium] sulci]